MVPEHFFAWEWMRKEFREPLHSQGSQLQLNRLPQPRKRWKSLLIPAGECPCGPRRGQRLQGHCSGGQVPLYLENLEDRRRGYRSAVASLLPSCLHCSENRI